MKINFIVLACSFKHHGRCVAGIDLTNKRLIRLISEDSMTNYAIPKNECDFNNRTLVPMDIIVVDIKRKAHRMGAQTENYYVDFPLIKKFLGKATEKDIKPYLTVGEKSPYPFDNKDPYLSKGYYHRQDRKDVSLWLMVGYKLKLILTKNSSDSDKTKISFSVYKYNKEEVVLENYSVTDPEYCIFDGKNRSGYTILGKAYLLISIGQDDDSDHYYKFVSGIIDVSVREDFFAIK